MEVNAIKSARNTCLDQIKGIAAVFVVFIHARFPGELGIIVDAIAKFAVPFFFMVSGYFFYCDDFEKSIKSLPHKIFNIAKIAGVVTICNIVRIVIQEQFKLDAILQWLQHNVLTTRHILEFLFLNNSAFSGVAWFLYALIYCYLIYAIAGKFNLLRFAWIGAIALVLVKVLGNILPVLEMIPYVRFLFLGVPFFGFGMLCKKYKKKIDDFPISIRKLETTILISFVITVIERFIIGESELFFGTIICAVCCFILALCMPNGFEKKKSLIRLGEYSLIIYVAHPIMIHIWRWVSQRIGIGILTEGTYLFPIIVCISTIFVAHLLTFITRQGKYR